MTSDQIEAALADARKEMNDAIEAAHDAKHASLDAAKAAHAAAVTAADKAFIDAKHTIRGKLQPKIDKLSTQLEAARAAENAQPTED